jgi:3-hydroxybutyryl-CoA dehydrogenase
MEARDLAPQLLVAGSGKTGRDIGLHFLAAGWGVTWLSRDPGRLAELSRRIGRKVGRPGLPAPAAAFRLVGEPGGPDPDLFVETVGEDAAGKRAVFDRVAPLLPSRTVLATNSSSLLPAEVHPRCLGAHFFYPLALTRLAEVVVPDGTPPATADRLPEILRGVGLRTIVQSPRTAFAVNRLLLPLQAAAVRALRAGWPAEVVDRASATPLFPVGQLALMDAVGLDVVAPAVANYLRRLPAGEAHEYAGLRSALEELLALGKRGSKNRDGFLAGAPLPFGAGAAPEGTAADLAQEFRAVARVACERALARGEIGAGDLDLALASLFGAETTLAAEVRP